MKGILFVFIIIFSTLFLSCSKEQNDNKVADKIAYIPMRSISHYDVINEMSEITVDGILDENAWDNISPIEGSFHYPWQKSRSPKTIFKAFQSGGNFYFSFISHDEDIIFSKDWEGERTVDDEDRVEIFFAQPSSIDKPSDNGMPKYYAIEIDPLA